jgi:hypothetical protein
MGLSYSQLEGLWIQAGGSAATAPIAAAIALAESAGNPSSYNGNAGTGDNSYGLWQINMIGSMGPARLKEFGLTSNTQLFDPLTNAKAALKVSNGGTNFGPWTTYTHGTYKKYLQGDVPPNMTAGGAGGTTGTGGAQLAAATSTPLGSIQETIGNIGNYLFFGTCVAGGFIILVAGLIMLLMSAGEGGVGAAGQLGRTSLAVATAGRKGSIR